MKRIFVLMLSYFVFSFFSFPVCAISEDAKSRYDHVLESLIKMVKSKAPSLGNDVSVFKELRFAYTDTPQYTPYGGIKTEVGKAMLTAINNNEYKKALEYAEKILKENFVDIDAHMVASTAYSKTGNQEKADYHQAFASGLLMSILSDGSGKTPESAIDVISIDEEYLLLNLFGLERKSAAELHANGHYYDKLTVVDSVSGKTFEMYFCIDKPYTWLLNSFKKAK
jgi:hypothetical protein